MSKNNLRASAPFSVLFGFTDEANFSTVVEEGTKFKASEVALALSGKVCLIRAFARAVSMMRNGAKADAFVTHLKGAKASAMLFALNSVVPKLAKEAGVDVRAISLKEACLYAKSIADAAWVPTKAVAEATENVPENDPVAIALAYKAVKAEQASEQAEEARQKAVLQQEAKLVYVSLVKSLINRSNSAVEEGKVPESILGLFQEMIDALGQAI